MEWLLNRRRMMYSKLLPPEYITFADNEVWKVSCYQWGDTELVQGEIDNDIIACNGSALVYSNYIFCPCVAIPSHKLSSGQTLSANAAAQTFSVTISVDNSSAFNNFGNNDTVIQIRQRSSTSASATVLTTVTKSDWTSNSSNNQITVNAAATNACMYLQIGVLAASGVTATWSVSAVTGNRQPVGITAQQCAAVTSIGSLFAYNPACNAFDTDSLYFTGLSSIGTRVFISSALTYIRLPYVVTAGNSTGGNYSVFYSAPELLATRLDSVTDIYAYNYNCSKYKYTVITTSEMATLRTTDNRHYGGKTYVKDSLVSIYQADDKWSSKTILPLSQLTTDYPDCPWLADLRAKGLIPSN